MADVDFAACDRPDELILLAWDAGYDRRAVIREGVDAAGLMLADRDELRTLFWPSPGPLEAVGLWSGDDGDAPAAVGLRPFASAVIPGCAMGTAVDFVVARPRMTEDANLSALVWIIVASVGALGFVFRLLIAAALRRRVGRLDEDSALALVLAQVRRGMAANPAFVPRACEWLRRGLPGAKREPPSHEQPPADKPYAPVP